jgi:hypothetical protein
MYTNVREQQGSVRLLDAVLRVKMPGLQSSNTLAQRRHRVLTNPSHAVGLQFVRSLLDWTLLLARIRYSQERKGVRRGRGRGV